MRSIRSGVREQFREVSKNSKPCLRRFWRVVGVVFEGAIEEHKTGAVDEHSEGGSRLIRRGVREAFGEVFEEVFENDLKECLEKCSISS